MVGRIGIEPITNGFSYPAVSGRTGLSHDPQPYLLGSRALQAVIKGTGPLR